MPGRQWQKVSRRRALRGSQGQSGSGRRAVAGRPYPDVSARVSVLGRHCSGVIARATGLGRQCSGIRPNHTPSALLSTSCHQAALIEQDRADRFRQTGSGRQDHADAIAQARHISRATGRCMISRPRPCRLLRPCRPAIRRQSGRHWHEPCSRFPGPWPDWRA